jgi:hypothetical protein
MDVLEDPQDELSNRIGYVGRTELVIDPEGGTSPSPMGVYHDADSTQLLLFPPSRTAWTVGPHSLLFTYHRDYGDEVTGMDHRYDRPTEFQRGKPDPEESLIEFRL